MHFRNKYTHGRWWSGKVLNSASGLGFFNIQVLHLKNLNGMPVNYTAVEHKSRVLKPKTCLHTTGC